MAVVCALVVQLCAHGSGAVFSGDGNFVYVAADPLLRLDLSRPNRFDAVETSTLFGGETVHDVARDTRGNILCVTAHHLVSFNPKTEFFTKLCDAPGTSTLREVACNPRDSLILVTLDTQSTEDFGNAPFAAICLLPGREGAIAVSSRMTGRIDAPAYDAYGNLYFGWRGDLWQGFISIGNADEWPGSAGSAPVKIGPGDKAVAYLMGDRIAPIARLRTVRGAAWNTGVFNIAIAADRFYLGMHAMGHEYAYLLMMARPDPTIDRPNPDLPEDNYQDFFDLMETVVKVPGDTLGYDMLCISPDGRRIFYNGNPGSYYLIDTDYPPRRLPVK